MATCYRCKVAPREINSYCRKCHNEYMLDRYYRIRDDFIARLGGACFDCGSTQQLEFDHVDPATKSFSMGSGIRRFSMTVLEAELAKCALRCKSCHTEKSLAEGDLGSVGHGEGVSGKKNCPCAPCKARKAEYMAAYKQRRKSSASGV